MEGNLLTPYMVLIVQHMTETCDRYETVCFLAPVFKCEE